MGWIRNIPTEIPFKGWPRGKTGQTGFRNWSDRFQKPVRPVSLRKPAEDRV
jgi:hypothetical protein